MIVDHLLTEIIRASQIVTLAAEMHTDKREKKKKKKAIDKITKR